MGNGSAAPAETLADKTFLADVAGIYAQHAAMLGAYGESMKLLLAVGSLPLLAAAAYLAATKEGLYLTKLPSFLTATLLVTPVLVYFVLRILISNRLTAMFYARMLNAMRAIYIPAMGEKERDGLQFWPQNPAIPPYHEPDGPTGIVVTLTGLVAGAYAGMCLANVLRLMLDYDWALAIPVQASACLAAGLAGLIRMRSVYQQTCQDYESSFERAVGRATVPAP